MAPTKPSPWSSGIPATIAGTNANATITYENGHFIVHLGDASTKGDAFKDIDPKIIIVILAIVLSLWALGILLCSCIIKRSNKRHGQSPPTGSDNAMADDVSEPVQPPGTDHKTPTLEQALVMDVVIYEASISTRKPLPCSSPSSTSSDGFVKGVGNAPYPVEKHY